ncbi:MAG: 5-oxoprolinase subunit PxpB [Bacteroidota bacterium]|nr:5-oxoprolinase subunit PxpB [Bacteroidota bacterium]
MGNYNLKYKPYGEKTLLIEWPSQIDECILYDIINLQKIVESNLAGIVVESVPAYQSLALFYDPSVISFEGLTHQVTLIYRNTDNDQLFQPKLWHIPVCYDLSFGIDLEYLSNITGLRINSIIELHIATVYTVYFIGFLPGFLYLGGLPETLHAPRKSSPRPKVLKGAVAIGGSQTGIYPMENHGGWNIIGNSPLHFLELEKHPPVFASAGDKVKFFPIELTEHAKILQEVNDGNCKLLRETIL